MNREEMLANLSNLNEDNSFELLDAVMTHFNTMIEEDYETEVLPITKGSPRENQIPSLDS